MGERIIKSGKAIQISEEDWLEVLEIVNGIISIEDQKRNLKFRGEQLVEKKD